MKRFLLDASLCRRTQNFIPHQLATITLLADFIFIADHIRGCKCRGTTFARNFSANGADPHEHWRFLDRRKFAKFFPAPRIAAPMMQIPHNSHTGFTFMR
jgi:hypothetical protein